MAVDSCGGAAESTEDGCSEMSRGYVHWNWNEWHWSIRSGGNGAVGMSSAKVPGGPPFFPDDQRVQHASVLQLIQHQSSVVHNRHLRTAPHPVAVGTARDGGTFWVFGLRQRTKAHLQLQSVSSTNSCRLSLKEPPEQRHGISCSTVSLLTTKRGCLL